MNIYLIGFMGSGKTTLGKRVANKLQRTFIDLDEEIEHSESSTISELFEKKGEDYFRQSEHNLLQRLSRLENHVVSTGGGAPCFMNNMSIMNDTGITIYLQINPGILASRIYNSPTERPLAKNKTLDELNQFIKISLGEREKFYLQAQIVISGDNIKADHILSQLPVFPKRNEKN